MQEGQVDRYIRDFETVGILTQISTDPVRIGQRARLNPRVVQQYLDLLPNDPRENGKGPAGEPEASPADVSKKTMLSEGSGSTIVNCCDV